MMLSAGEHPMWVAKQMGHTDWAMIARVFGRWMPDADPSACQKAVPVFGRAPGYPLQNVGGSNNELKAVFAQHS